MKRRGRFSQWLKERLYSILEELIAAAIIAAVGYIWGVWTGRLPSTSLPWLGGISLTLIMVIAVAVALTIVTFVFWRRSHRRKVKPMRPVVTVPEDFVGREEEIAWFQEMLQGKTSERIMSICGAPGIGKSWLVNRLAKECEDVGVDWAIIDFRETAHDPLTLLDAIQYRLGEEPFTRFSDTLREYIEFRAQQLREYPSLDDMSRRVLFQRKEGEVVDEFLRCLMQLAEEKQVILLLDSFEKVEDTELARFLQKRLLAELKDRSLPNFMVVIAGWNRLAWRDGWEWIISAHELKHFSVEEIRGRLAINMEIDAEAVDIKLAAAVLEYTEGHPLGVGLAATLVVESVKKGEQISRDMFPTLEGELDERMRTELLMRGVWEQLDRDVMEVVWLCAVPRWFDAGMIRLLKGLENGSEALLDRITEYRAFVKAHSPSGYEYHEIVRDLLLSKWQRDDPDKFIELNERAGKFYEEKLEKIKQAGRRFSEEWQRLTLERVYHWLRADEDIGVRLLSTLFGESRAFYRLGFCKALVNEGKEAQLRKKASIQRIKYYECALIAEESSWIDVEDAMEELLASDLDEDLKWEVMWSYGTLKAFKAEPKIALDYHDRGLELLQASGQEETHAACVLLRGSAGLLYKQGQIEKALGYLSRGLEISGKIKDAYSRYDMLDGLGKIYLMRNCLEEAVRCWRETLELAKSLGNDAMACGALGRLGLAYIAQREFSEALSTLKSAMHKAKKLGSEPRVAWISRHFGLLYQAQGRYKEACRYYTESANGYRQRRSTDGLFRTLVLLCDCLYYAGDHEQLRAQLGEMGDLAGRVKLQDWVARWSVIQAHMELDQALESGLNLEAAIIKYTRAMKMALQCHRYILDEVIGRILWRMNVLASQGHNEETKIILKRLAEFWKDGMLEDKAFITVEQGEREQEPGDGKPQIPVLEQLERALYTKQLLEYEPVIWAGI